MGYKFLVLFDEELFVKLLHFNSNTLALKDLLKNLYPCKLGRNVTKYLKEKNEQIQCLKEFIRDSAAVSS